LALAELDDTRSRLASSPAWPLTLVIPSYWKRDLDEVPNNLPVPEYDDTGFIGRKADRESTLRLFHGAHRVVTITGEGGVGKTSLALQTLYDAASAAERPFDHIVWVSLKTETLTTAGARQIADALTTPAALLERIAAVGGEVPSFDDLDGLIEYVIELVRDVRVLLAIDNLETIDRDALRPLFLELPATSKVLVTSRFGIGEFETRYPLSPMDRKDAIRLVRSLARLLNADGLLRRDDQVLSELCERLFFNPLAIRWFVQSFSEGRAVADLLERRRDLGEVLNFCFHTLYESLTEEHRNYLRLMVAIGKPLSEVQLALLAGAPSLEELRASLHYLHSSNLVRRTNDDWATSVSSLWTTSDFARAYIVNRDTKILPERPNMVRRYRALIQARDDARDATAYSPFRSGAIDARTTDEASVVYLLRQAQRDAAESAVRNALEALDKAKHLQPGFYEVWRVSAQVRAAADPIGAQQDFDRALELAGGKSGPLLAHVAKFLADQDDEEGAVEILEPAAEATDADPHVVAAYAWVLGLSGNLGKSLAQFDRARARLDEFGGRERAYLSTQHVEILKRAAEVELDRQLPDAALTHLMSALDIVTAACVGNYVDRVLVRAGADVVDTACRVIARRCAKDQWTNLHMRLTRLREFIPLAALAGRGADVMSVACPAISSTAEFKELFGGDSAAPRVMFGDVLAPGTGRDYTFIRADDGQDYFLHRSDVADGTAWDQIGRPGASRIRFRPGDARQGRNPPARTAVLIHLDEP
jgi:LuxR family glucitol operon transcriptional activator